MPAVNLQRDSGMDEAGVALPSATLASLPLGGRLLIRLKKDWRAAAVVKRIDEVVVLSVASPGGHSYRVRRPLDAGLRYDGTIPFLVCEFDAEPWRQNFSSYDLRW